MNFLYLRCTKKEMKYRPKSHNAVTLTSQTYKITHKKRYEQTVHNLQTRHHSLKTTSLSLAIIRRRSCLAGTRGPLTCFDSCFCFVPGVRIARCLRPADTYEASLEIRSCLEVRLYRKREYVLLFCLWV